MGIGEEKTAMERFEPETLVEWSVEALKQEQNVTFDQSMMLVNEQNPLQEQLELSIAPYKATDVLMNECIREAYMNLSDAVAKQTGQRLLVSSAYRTAEKQQELYDADPTTANKPGTSEHETGLALDVYIKQYAAYGFLKTHAGKFVNSDCWRYGFIIRYPVYGREETGVKYEPWHLRYVGQPHAAVIYNNHMTLEGYLQSLEIGTWYRVDGYLISRQKEGDTFLLPENYESAVISPDNTGCYIITACIVS